MRALVTLLLLVQLAGVARADDLYERGRRKQRAGIALIVIGSALIVAGAVVMFVGMVGQGNGPPENPSPTSELVYIGAGMFAPGVATHAIGLPLEISGTVDVDRWRDGKTASIATVRF